MEITYDSGAKVILEGPCRYEVESATGGFLAVGKLTARVEKRGEGGGRRAEGEVDSGQWAMGSESEIRNPKSEISNPQSPISNPLFVVRTPAAVVTDLGTEFGVEVTADQRSKVSVFAGQVELRTAGSIKASRQRRVLARGQLAVVDDGAVIVQSSQSPQPRDADVQFVRRMPLRRSFVAIDLKDIMFGGASRSRQASAAATGPGGMVPLPNLNFQDHEYHYHPIPSNPMIDGVFVLPQGGSGLVQLDSAGHTFGGFSKPRAIAADAVGAGVTDAQGEPIPRSSEQRSGHWPGIHAQGRGVFMPPLNQGITFDLVAICKAQPGIDRPIRFRASGRNGATEGAGGFLGLCRRAVEIPSRRLDKQGRRGSSGRGIAAKQSVSHSCLDQRQQRLRATQRLAPPGAPTVYVAPEQEKPPAEERPAGKEGSSMN